MATSAGPDQSGRRNQRASGRALGKTFLPECANGLTEPHQTAREADIAGRFLHDDALFDFGGRVAEFNGDHALARGRFQILQYALIAWVVGQHQHELRRCGQAFSQAFDVEFAPMVRQRMDHDRRVRARFDDFIEITDSALTHGTGQGTILPDGFPAAQQKAPHQIARSQILVTRHRDQGPAEFLRHGLHQPGFPAAGGALQQHGQLVGPSRLKDLFFGTRGNVSRHHVRTLQLPGRLHQPCHCTGLNVRHESCVMRHAPPAGQSAIGRHA